MKNPQWRRLTNRIAPTIVIVLMIMTVMPIAIARDDIDIVATRHGVQPDLLRAVCLVESSWRADAIGDDGESIGLCQVQIDTGLMLQGRQWKPGASVAERRAAMHAMLLSPQINIHLAAKLLRQHLDRFGGDETLALIAYNGGPNHKLIRYVLKVQAARTRPAGGVADQHPQRLTVSAPGATPPPEQTPSAARHAALILE